MTSRKFSRAHPRNSSWLIPEIQQFISKIQPDLSHKFSLFHQRNTAWLIPGIRPDSSQKYSLTHPRNSAWLIPEIQPDLSQKFSLTHPRNTAWLISEMQPDSSPEIRPHLLSITSTFIVEHFNVSKWELNFSDFNLKFFSNTELFFSLSKLKFNPRLLQKEGNAKYYWENDHIELSYLFVFFLLWELLSWKYGSVKRLINSLRIDFNITRTKAVLWLNKVANCFHSVVHV